MISAVNKRNRTPLMIRVLIWGAIPLLAPVSAHAAQSIVVALGASQTYGKGVSRSEAYPAQLEALLRAKGRDVKVINAGISGDTTEGMLNRLDSAVPTNAQVVILQPGGNDLRHHRNIDTNGNIAQVTGRLKARHIKVIMMENSVFASMTRGPDGQHLTPEGYHQLALRFLPSVLKAIGR